MDEVARASRLRRALERLGGALDPGRQQDREQLRAVVNHLQELRVDDGRRADALKSRLDAIERSADGLRQDATASRRALERMRQGLARERGQVNRLLRRSGVDQRSAETEERVTARMARIARSRLPVIVGPWTGEVGFELLYWIPFLHWVRETFPIDPSRLIVVSRGGVASWYGHVTSEYEDIFSGETPETFRAATEEHKKQQRIHEFDRRIIRRVMRGRGIRQAHLLHPTLMYALFNSFWRYGATVKRLEEFARFRRLAPTNGVLDGAGALPERYVAVRFYFSECFPDTPENRAFAAQVVDGLAARGDVVLLNSDLVVDDHRDCGFDRPGRVHVLSPHMRPEDNLALQTAAISRATAFVGTYGGYSYLAPLCGVSSVAFYSRQSFKQHHLELAHRAFQRLGGAQLMPVDVRRAQPLAAALSGVVASRHGMNALAHATVEALRSVLEPLPWPDRFEEIARAYNVADPETRDAIATLRTELADRALGELSVDWNGAPFKEAALRVPGKRLRGALTRAAKAARNRFIVETVRAGGPPLAPLEPGGRFGAGLDERSVEMPLAIAVAALDRPGLVLDAGAALNLPLVRQVAPAPAAQLTHFTLPGSNEPRLPDADGHFEYAFGDLRMMPYPDATFDRVVCVSTLEHVGMDTTRFGAAPSGAGDASRAVAELVRVLAPGGTLFLTVPYGRAADHGWFRVLDRAGLHSLLQPVAAHQVALRFFYYEQGWVEGREEPPARVVDSQFDSDVVSGVAIAHVIKQ